MGEADQSYVNASESVLYGEDTGESANMIKAINLRNQHKKCRCFVIVGFI